MVSRYFYIFEVGWCVGDRGLVRGEFLGGVNSVGDKF